MYSAIGLYRADCLAGWGSLVIMCVILSLLLACEHKKCTSSQNKTTQHDIRTRLQQAPALPRFPFRHTSVMPPNMRSVDYQRSRAGDSNVSRNNWRTPTKSKHHGLNIGQNINQLQKQNSSIQPTLGVTYVLFALLKLSSQANTLVRPC